MVLRSPTSDSQDSDSDQSPLRNNEPIFRPLENTSVVPSHLSLKPTQTIETMPIFTLPQVTALCERLIKEREAELREEYDNILSCKLAEQYEAFLKFNHDQLYSRFQNSPMSYVS
nr:Transmembrane 9 superfamily protein member 4 [Schistosoma japonicum]